jgi:hypothetical protein
MPYGMVVGLPVTAKLIEVETHRRVFGRLWVYWLIKTRKIRALTVHVHRAPQNVCADEAVAANAAQQRNFIVVSGDSFAKVLKRHRGVFCADLYHV